jgi:DNA-binding MarR family transcriptional regulator
MRDIRKRDSGPAGPRPRRARRRRDLERSVANELGRAFRRLNRTVSAALRSHGLSAIQANILITLWARGTTPIGELQKAMGLSSSAFSGAIDRMERAGLVRRLPSPSDRRSLLVEPARWGEARRAAVIEALLDAEDAFLAPLDAAQRAALRGLLRALAAEKEVGDA